MSLLDAGKRVLVGRKLRSSQLGHTLLPKRVALPVFASDALSSVAYAPDEIFIVLGAAGIAGYTLSLEVGLAVAAVLAVVVASYRQNVQEYQSGGGDYEVATVNLGPTAGVGVASALLVDYVLVVAVSLSSAAQYAASAVDFLAGHEATVAVVVLVLLMTANLRGIRESGTAFAVPTYLFIVSILGMLAWGFFRHLLGDGLPPAPSAGLTPPVESEFEAGLVGLGGALLLLRAFSSGCAALTGVEAISNGVPAFRKPKGRNAATTLLLLGAIAVSMGLGVIALGNITGVRLSEHPEEMVSPNGQVVGAGYEQDPMIGQLATSIFSDFPVGFFLVVAVTGIILVLAANTAFSGFPILGSILARDGYLPRQLHTRGDRLAFSNGIIVLAVLAAALIVAFDAEVTALIQLYIVGVFVSFTLSQAGMVRHWSRILARTTTPHDRRRLHGKQAISGVGCGVTGIVLVVVLITKFAQGAWITVLAMGVWFALMQGIQRHYDRVRAELVVTGDDKLLPSRVHAIVLVSRLHKPAMRALSYARAARPNTLEAVTVDVEPDATAALLDDWDRNDVQVPLKVLASPYREVTRPIIDYVRAIRRESPRDVVSVYIPEYVVGHWWEQLLHNQSALRLKGRLLFTPGVMVTNVPYQLASSFARADDHDRVDVDPHGRRNGLLTEHPNVWVAARDRLRRHLAHRR